MTDKNPASDLPAARSFAHERKMEYFEDHRALRTLISRAETTRDLRQLSPLLDELHRFLEDHFRSEEAPDGLRGIIRDAAPNRLGQLEQLLEAHRDLLAKLRNLREEVREIVDGPVTQVLRELKLLCDRLEEHEAAETRILTDSLYTDLGESP
jgi:hemerythrin